MTDTYLDPKELYSEHLDSWDELWNYDLSLYQNVYNITSQLVVIPKKSIMLPIAVTYMLIPSKWSFKCGILFSWGDEGSGKSTIAKLATRLHGFTTLFSPADTFASVRNALDNMRWIDVKTKEYEKEGALLCWDNIHDETLEQDIKLYQLLLFGYDRNTDKISIAAPDGTNKEYFVYSPKIIASINPIHQRVKFTELIRRLIIIPHKKFDKFTLEEKAEYQGFDFTHDCLDFDSISWDGIEENFYLFWNNPEKCKEYVAWRKMLTQKGKKSFTVPPTINSSNWIISIDLITTGMVVGTWSDLQTAINDVGKYWEYANNVFFTDYSATLSHLRDFIFSECNVHLEINKTRQSLGEAIIPIIINPTKLKNFLNILQNEGKLDISPKQKDINELMWKLGWKLTTDGWMQR